MVRVQADAGIPYSRSNRSTNAIGIGRDRGPASASHELSRTRATPFSLATSDTVLPAAYHAEMAG